MKKRVQIDGYINVDDVVTEEQVREAVMFQLGWGGMSVSICILKVLQFI